jgi:hypothetical protein
MAVASPPVFELPQRSLFDVVAANDVTTLLTVVRGDNPFDVSPGMELIRIKKRGARQPYAENAGIVATAGVNIDVAQIPHLRDGRGNGAAHVAARFGLSSMLEVLVNECGCAVDEYNELGLTPLHEAAMHGHVDCVRLLCNLGAAPLSTTHCAVSASLSSEAFLRGRSTFFLAHYAKHASVLTFLEPFYAQLIKSACDGQSAAQVWENAATQQNMQVLSLLLDAVECVNSIIGPLPLSFGLDVVAGLREAVPAMLPVILPAEHRATREQLFLFQRLVHLGFLDGATGFSTSGTVLDRVLSTSQVKAWRVLVEEGGVDPRKCDTDAVRSSGYSGNGEEELNLLITAAKTRAQYEREKQKYERKGDGAGRREALLSSREAWKRVQSKMQRWGIPPATTYPS